MPSQFHKVKYFTLGVSAPLPADLSENHVGFCPRLCCLFYRSLSLCCEGLRLLLMEVNLHVLCFPPFYSIILYQYLVFLTIRPSSIFCFHSVLLHPILEAFNKDLDGCIIINMFRHLFRVMQILLSWYFTNAQSNHWGIWTPRTDDS